MLLNWFWNLILLYHTSQFVVDCFLELLQAVQNTFDTRYNPLMTISGRVMDRWHNWIPAKISAAFLVIVEWWHCWNLARNMSCPGQKHWFCNPWIITDMNNKLCRNFIQTTSFTDHARRDKGSRLKHLMNIDNLINKKCKYVYCKQNYSTTNKYLIFTKY